MSTFNYEKIITEKDEIIKGLMDYLVQSVGVNKEEFMMALDEAGMPLDDIYYHIGNYFD